MEYENLFEIARKALPFVVWVVATLGLLKLASWWRMSGEEQVFPGHKDAAEFPELFAPLTVAKLRMLYDSPRRIEGEVAALVERMEIIEAEIRRDVARTSREIAAAVAPQIPATRLWRPELDPRSLEMNVSMGRGSLPEFQLAMLESPIGVLFESRPVMLKSDRLRANGAKLVEEALRDPLRAAVHYPTVTEVARAIGYEAWAGLLDRLADDRDWDHLIWEHRDHVKHLQAWIEAGSPDFDQINERRQAKAKKGQADEVDSESAVYI